MSTNMDLLSKTLIFAAGVAIGSAVTWKMLKSKYEQIAQEEIDSVKAEFGIGVKKQSETKPDIVEEKTEEKDNHSLKEYNKLVNANYITNYSDIKKEEDEDDVEKPYVIPPEEYDEMDDYEAVELTYYACGTLTDECNNIIEDVDEIVGNDFSEHFGEYEDDSVYIRNDRLQCDYAILRDNRHFSDL